MSATVEGVPRPLRTSFPDGLYHITGHATGSENLFRAPLDHDDFKGLLARIADRHGWRVHARCTMGNHFHLVVHTTREHMSAGMHALQHTYAKWFNKRYGRRGCLFAGRYDSKWIVDEEHYAKRTRVHPAEPGEGRLLQAG